MEHQNGSTVEVELASAGGGGGGGGGVRPQPTSPNCTSVDGLPFIDGVQQRPGGSGVLGAVFNLTTSNVGVGIMALPASMRVLGLLLGFVAVVSIGVLTEFSIEILIRFAVFCKSTTYGDAVRSALGGPAKMVAQIFIVVNNAGILVVYLIIIGDVMSGTANHDGVFHQWFGSTGLDHRELVIFLVLVIFLTPLCLLENIDSLVLSSAAAIIIAVFFVVISCSVAFVRIVKGTARKPRMGPDLGSRQAVLDLLVVIPIMTNAYVCHFNLLPIYNELRDRSVQKMNRVGRMTMVICVAVYALTALSGYLLFGEDTEADVLTNFDRDLGVRFSTTLNYIIRIGYVFHIILTFPIIHFSMRQTVSELAFGDSSPSPSPSPTTTSERNRHRILTAVLLTVVYLGSIAIPNIWVAFRFTGATTAVSLGFIFPALIALRLDYHGGILASKEKIVVWFMLVLAVVVGVIGIVGTSLSINRRPA